MPTRPGSRQRNYAFKPAVRDRGRLSEFYNTGRWKRERTAFRREHPLCAECKRNGRLKPSEVVDHLIPHPIVDFWNRDNWQALCRRCNLAKGVSDAQMLKEYHQRSQR